MAGPTVAVYAGSFDPVTLGHLDVAKRASSLFDSVILATGNNPAKRYLLTLDERMAVLRDATSDIPGIEVTHFEGLLVNFCKDVGAGAIIRGMRAVTDFEFEFQIGLANMDMAPEIETLFLLSNPQNIFITSSLIKEIASNGGDVSRYLPAASLAAVTRALKAKG